MGEPAIRLSGFTQRPPRKASTCAKPLNVDLSEKARRRLGDVFGILKAEASEENCEALAAHIEDALIRGVFETLRRLPEDAPQESILESAIAKVNDALYRLLGEDGLSLGPETISGVIVAQKGKEISASFWGKPALLLFRRNDSGPAKVYDLAESESGQMESGRGFSQIISGCLTDRDRLMAASDDLRRQVGESDLAQMALQESPEEAVLLVRKATAGLKLEFGFSLFLSDNGQKRPGQPVRRRAEGLNDCVAAPTDSLGRLVATESETSEIMSPPILKTTAKRLTAGLAAAAGRISEIAREMRARPPSGLPKFKPAGPKETETDGGTEPDAESAEEAVLPVGEIGDSFPDTDENSGTTGEKDGEGAEQALTAGSGDAGEGKDSGEDSDDEATEPEDETEGPKSSEEFAGEPESSAAPEPAARQARWNPLSDLIEAINDLPTYGKALLVAMLIGLSAINLSGLLMEWRDSQREVTIAYESDLGEIEERLDTAEASMIYRDDARTRSLLGQAAEMIAALPERTETQRRDRDALSDRLEGMRREVNRVTALPDPETVASLNGEAGPLAVSRLIGLGGRTYVLAGENRTRPFAVDAGGGATALAPPLDAEPALFLADGSGSRLLAIQADGRLSAWPFAGSRTASGTVAWNAADIRPTAAVAWGSRLYVLDAPHSRILLHQATETGYGPSQPYLKDGTDVSRGVDLAVDGSLYILQGDGQVIKVRLGERQNFAVAPVEPAFSQAAAIHTEEAGNRLWILDPANRRIAAFSKDDGSLAGQYVHDRLADAVGLAVSESDGTALVAVGHEVLKFRLAQ